MKQIIGPQTIYIKIRNNETDYWSTDNGCIDEPLKGNLRVSPSPTILRLFILTKQGYAIIIK